MIHQKIPESHHFVYISHLLTKECYIKRNRRWVIHICNKRMPHHYRHFVYISHLLTKECYIKRYRQTSLISHLLTKECYIKRYRQTPLCLHFTPFNKRMLHQTKPTRVIHICNKRMPHHKIPTSQLFVYISHLLTKECYIKRYRQRSLFTFHTFNKRMLHQTIPTNTALFTFHTF